MKDHRLNFTINQLIFLFSQEILSKIMGMSDLFSLIKYFSKISNFFCLTKSKRCLIYLLNLKEILVWGPKNNLGILELICSDFN